MSFPGAEAKVIESARIEDFFASCFTSSLILSLYYVLEYVMFHDGFLVEGETLTKC